MNDYLENEILQADPLKLIQLLYRGALDSIRRAQSALAANDISERSRQITKSMEIVTELMLSVDRQRGGELAANLIELYDYVLRTLAAAQIEQSALRLDEAAKVLQTLLEGWEQMIAHSTTIPAAPTADYSPVSVAF